MASSFLNDFTDLRYVNNSPPGTYSIKIYRYLSSWVIPSNLTSNGKSILFKITISDLMWSTYLSLIMSAFFNIFKAQKVLS